MGGLIVRWVVKLSGGGLNCQVGSLINLGWINISGPSGFRAGSTLDASWNKLFIQGGINITVAAWLNFITLF